jgi:predicted phosphodiesterase
VKLGVIADIHGNDAALGAVLKDADRFGVERWWALGDLVLFGPRPAEVLELVSTRRLKPTTARESNQA